MISSVRSRISSIGTVTDHKSLRRSDSLLSEPEFDEPAPSCDAEVSSSGVGELEGSLVGSVNPEESESESDSLSAWRDRIRGISHGSAARITSIRHDSIKEQASWFHVYNTNPEIELTVLLLQVRGS